METVGKHLRNASSKFDDSTRILEKLENRVNMLAGAHPAQPGALYEDDPVKTKRTGRQLEQA